MTTFGIGASVKRREDQRLLTGEGRFADDFNGLGQAHAAFVRSPHAHADVLAIDAAPAKAVAGVLAVFTGHDLAADGVGGIPTLIAERGGNIRSRDGSPFAEPTWLALATDRVRHVGEPIAMVVATTPAQARDGAEAVVVRYAARPAVVANVKSHLPRFSAAPCAKWYQFPIRSCKNIDRCPKPAVRGVNSNTAMTSRPFGSTYFMGLFRVYAYRFHDWGFSGLAGCESTDKKRPHCGMVARACMKSL